MKKGISLAIICRAGAYGWAISFTLALIANSFKATGQVQFHVPGGSSAIVNNTANGNLAIGMSPSPNATLSIDANGLKPLDIFTADATYRFATHAFTLMSRPGFSHVPYIEWRMSDNIRQAYFGYDPDVFKLGLDNGFNFMIEGGRVGVGTATPIGTLDVKAHEVSVVNTESPIFNLLSRPSTGTTDNLFQFNQGVGAGTGETFAVLRMGNHYTNYGVPDEIVLRANGDSFFNSGNVGVGTNTPVEQFQIGDRWTFHDGGHKIIGYNFRFDGGPKRILEDEASALRFTESGEIRFDVGGSGSSGSTINFTTALTINNDGAITWGNGGILKTTNGSSIELGGAGTPYLDFKNDNNTDYDARFILYDDNTLVLAGTNLLMGKTSQANTSYKIDVAGKIRGNEIVVNTDGADYVFDPSYKLTPLDTLEAYVREHRHLPGIAPAREMQHEGMAVGETTTKLLEKIEELTLYVIELKNENAVQESRMEKAAETHSAVLERIERLTLLVEAQQKQIERLKKENQ